MQLRVKKLVPTASLPFRGSEAAAGYDLSACLVDENGHPRNANAAITINPGARALVPTGLALTVPDGTYGRIGPRSGLALRHGIDILAGIIDQDYTAEIGVVMVNLGDQPFLVEDGMRIAQLVIERISTPKIVEVDQLAETIRGEGGFGSTGS